MPHKQIILIHLSISLIDRQHIINPYFHTSLFYARASQLSNATNGICTLFFQVKDTELEAVKDHMLSP
jgi:hypothetical protein